MFGAVLFLFGKESAMQDPLPSDAVRISNIVTTQSPGACRQLAAVGGLEKPVEGAFLMHAARSALDTGRRGAGACWQRDAGGRVLFPG